jgi:hypothetical protein
VSALFGDLRDGLRVFRINPGDLSAVRPIAMGKGAAVGAHHQRPAALHAALRVVRIVATLLAAIDSYGVQARASPGRTQEIAWLSASARDACWRRSSARA